LTAALDDSIVIIPKVCDEMREGLKWWRCRDSNPGHRDYDSNSRRNSPLSYIPVLPRKIFSFNYNSVFSKLEGVRLCLPQPVTVGTAAGTPPPLHAVQLPKRSVSTPENRQQYLQNREREWIIQEYRELTREWVDLTSRSELMTRTEMMEKLKQLDNSTSRELRGHNVINNARHGQR